MVVFLYTKRKGFCPRSPLKSQNFICISTFFNVVIFFNILKNVHMTCTHIGIFLFCMPSIWTNWTEKYFFNKTSKYFSCLCAWVRHYTKQSCYCFITKDENRNVNMSLWSTYPVIQKLVVFVTNFRKYTQTFFYRRRVNWKENLLFCDDDLFKWKTQIFQQHFTFSTLSL